MNNKGLLVKFSSEETPSLFKVSDDELKNIDSDLFYGGRPIFFKTGTTTVHLNWNNIDYIKVIYEN